METGGEVVCQDAVTGVWRKQVDKVSGETERRIQRRRIVRHLRSHTLRIVDIDDNVLFGIQLLPGRDNGLSKGKYQKEQEQHSGCQDQIVLQPSFRGGYFLYLFEKTVIRKQHPSSAPEVEKVDYDRYGKGGERPQE